MSPTLIPLSLLSAFSYPALILTTIVAQPAAALISGALAAAGIVHWELVFVAVAGTDLAMDCVWYVLGARHGEKTTRFIKKVLRLQEEDMERVQNIFHTKPAHILVTAKLLGGFGMMPFILFTAGASKMRFGRYIALNSFGEIFWTGGLMLLGYFFSSAIGGIQSAIGKASLLAAFAAVLVLCYFGMRSFVRNILK
jgi:membrane-associated protein